MHNKSGRKVSQSLQQVLEKGLHIEIEDRGHQCTKRVQTCSKCKQAELGTIKDHVCCNLYDIYQGVSNETNSSTIFEI